MTTKRVSINGVEFSQTIQQGISGGSHVTHRSYCIQTETSVQHVTRGEFCLRLHQAITSMYPEIELELDEGRRRYFSKKPKKPVNGYFSKKPVNG